MPGGVERQSFQAKILPHTKHAVMDALMKGADLGIGVIEPEASLPVDIGVLFNNRGYYRVYGKGKERCFLLM